MRILVCARPVHNPQLPVGAAAGRPRLEDIEGYCPVPNPQDEHGLEHALRLKDRYGFPVTVLSVGGRAGEAVVREFMACGADEGVVLEEPAWEPDNSIVAGRIVEYCSLEAFDLYLFGVRDSERLSGEVGPMVAAAARLHYVAPVVDLEWLPGRGLLVSRKVKRATERIRLGLPVCVGILRGPALRYPSFLGRLEVEQRGVERRGAPPEPRPPRIVRVRFSPPKPKRRSPASTVQDTGGSAARVARALGLSLERPESRVRGCLMVGGDPAEAARRLFDLMRGHGLVGRNQ